LRFTRRLAAFTATAAALAGAAPAAAQDTDAAGQRAYAVDAFQGLYRLTLGAPLTTLRSTPITGLPAGSAIVGIDERPLDGQLYAVLRSTTNNSAAVYTIDPGTAQASFAFTLVGVGTSTPVTLNGTVGVDFNPMADALRIVTSTGQNLRALPSARIVGGVQRFAGDTFTDGTLNYAGATALGITEAAYVNNVPFASSTGLLDIDENKADLVSQSPPNNGTLAFVADLNLGTRPVQGFDIAPPPGQERYVVLGNVRVGDARASRVFAMDAMGGLTPLGTFPTNAIVDLAVDLP
jgi:hypothetical protein